MAFCEKQNEVIINKLKVKRIVKFFFMIFKLVRKSKINTPTIKQIGWAVNEDYETSRKSFPKERTYESMLLPFLWEGRGWVLILLSLLFCLQHPHYCR